MQSVSREAPHSWVEKVLLLLLLVMLLNAWSNCDQGGWIYHRLTCPPSTKVVYSCVTPCPGLAFAYGKHSAYFHATLQYTQKQFKTHTLRRWIYKNRYIFNKRFHKKFALLIPELEIRVSNLDLGHLFTVSRLDSDSRLMTQKGIPLNVLGLQ